jgi:hypothetical protein
MDVWLEILKYTLPSVVVLLTAFFLIRMFLRNEDLRRKHELSMSYKDHILPLRLQAYERLVLLLERLSPDTLVMRIGQTSLNVLQVQNELIKIVRTEFEHNLVQQTYVSNKAWEMIKHARNNTIKLINSAASDLKPNMDGMALNKHILELTMELDTSPNQEAINYLKMEVKEMF